MKADAVLWARVGSPRFPLKGENIYWQARGGGYIIYHCAEAEFRGFLPMIGIQELAGQKGSIVVMRRDEPVRTEHASYRPASHCL
jgi:hypothetical protein